MRVVQLPRRFVRSHWGGTETVILETSKRLLRRGHDTAILCPNALADSDEETIEGVPVRRVPYFYPYLGLGKEARHQLDMVGGSLFSFHLMRSLARWPSLDVLHLHTGKRPGAIGRYVARRRGIPYVVSLHGGVFDVPAGGAAALSDPTRGTLEWGKVLGWWVGSRRVLEDAAAIICVGHQELAAVSRRYPTRRCVLLPNGVDAARFASGDGVGFRRRHGVPSDARVVLCVGRIDPQKNQRMLVEMMPALRERVPSAHLLLVGPVTNPAYESALRETMSGAMTLIPGLDGSELSDCFHAADCFVLPSTHEPFGIVILEAWASGLPVVASRVGGVPGFVSDGEDGLLCPVGDISAFLSAVSTVLTDEPLARRLAARGLGKARGPYAWDNVTDSLLQIYEDVIRENPLRK